MRARILALACLLLLAATTVPWAAQTGGDKKPDQTPKKDQDKINASTEFSGKNFGQWVELIHGKDRSLTEIAVTNVLQYPPDVAKNAVSVMLAELKKPAATIDTSVRTDIPGPLAMILSSLPNPNPNEVNDAVTVLTRMVNDPQIIVRVRAIQALGQMGPMAKAALPELVKVAKDPYSPSWELRKAAVFALGRVGYEGKSPPQVAVVEALLHAMKDNAFRVRLDALDSLFNIRAGDADQYKKKVLEYMDYMSKKDSDPLCKLRAHLFIYPHHMKEPEKKLRIGEIAKFLDHSDSHIRFEATKSLGDIGPDAKDQVPRLLRLLREAKANDLILAACAMWSLGQMGKAGEPALEDLRAIAADMTMPEVCRTTASDAIEYIQGRKKKEEPKKGSSK